MAPGGQPSARRSASRYLSGSVIWVYLIDGLVLLEENGSLGPPRSSFQPQQVLHLLWESTFAA